MATKQQVQQLNVFLESRSYIEGYTPSQSDISVLEALKKELVDTKLYPHVARWMVHIHSFGESPSKFPGAKKTLESLGIFSSAVSEPASSAKAAADDDLDLFGSDEEEDAEAEALKAQRLAEYQAKKSAKPKVIAKSSVIIDIKPWEDTTDMKEMETRVRGIQMDGLIWGTSKLVPIGYGIKKLQLSCAIEDDKVSMDTIEEQILAFEDLVQSMDIVAFNKI